MKLNENAGMVLLGILLILVGIGLFFSLNLFTIFPDSQYLTYGSIGLCVLILILVLAGQIKENIGMVITALWFLLIGLMSFLNFRFTYSDLILALLPIGAGAFLIMGL